ncbi:zinc finger CCCH domain-containing protein 7B isoform X2 [Hyperolius riggenbachi]|uniref:zinc finger CCCH domain-containing protein 7B isoform X2 n=1 Tax=Hyperolius riggenbachi TaxID=752182 RepID=UPI0035A28B81
MSTKKAAKKKRASDQKVNYPPVKKDITPYVRDLIETGIEHFAYRWCLEVGGDPERTVFLTLLPRGIPDFVVCGVVAKTINRGRPEVLDRQVHTGGVTSDCVIVQFDEKVDTTGGPQAIPFTGCPCGFFLLTNLSEEDKYNLFSDDLTDGATLVELDDLPPDAIVLPALKNQFQSSNALPPEGTVLPLKDFPKRTKELSAGEASSPEECCPLYTGGHGLPAICFPQTEVPASVKGSSQGKALQKHAGLLPPKEEPISLEMGVFPMEEFFKLMNKHQGWIPIKEVEKYLIKPEAKTPPSNGQPSQRKPPKREEPQPQATAPEPPVKDLPPSKHCLCPKPAKSQMSQGKPRTPVEQKPASTQTISMEASLPSEGMPTTTKGKHTQVKPGKKQPPEEMSMPSVKNLNPPEEAKGELSQGKLHPPVEKPPPSSSVEPPRKNLPPPEKAKGELSQGKPPTPVEKPPPSSSVVLPKKDLPPPEKAKGKLSQGKPPTPGEKPPPASSVEPPGKNLPPPEKAKGKLSQGKPPTPGEKPPPASSVELPGKNLPPPEKVASPDKNNLSKVKPPTAVEQRPPETIRTTSVKDPPPSQKVPPPGKGKRTKVKPHTPVDKQPPVTKLALPVKDSLPADKPTPPSKAQSSQVKPLQLAEVQSSGTKLVTPTREFLSMENVPVSAAQPPLTVKKQGLHQTNLSDEHSDRIAESSYLGSDGSPNEVQPPAVPLLEGPYEDAWEGASMERRKRKEDIEKGLQFIQSTIPFNGGQDAYKHFLQELVENLYKEGNDLYREKKAKLALGQYMEALNVSDYASCEGLVLCEELLCHLYVNRSCCYYSLGLYEKSLEDSEEALKLDKENTKALYRKAKTLDKLGKHQEAYSCISNRILTLVQDESVTELAQELVRKLGMKERRAYKRPQVELDSFGLLSNGVSKSANKTSSIVGTVDDLYTDLPRSSSGAVTASLANAARSEDDFVDCYIIGDELDSFLEQEMASKHMPQLIPVFPSGSQLVAGLGAAVRPGSSPLPPASFGTQARPALAPLRPPFGLRLDTLDSFDTSQESLDSLDTFTIDSRSLEPLTLRASSKPKNGGMAVNHKTDTVTYHAAPHTPAVAHSPLMLSYEFKQGCQQCYVKTGPKALDFTHREREDHKCKKEILLVRAKNSENKAWLKVRQRPPKVTSPYMLCKDIQSRNDCKYGDNCTFAYYQEEVDVWTAERKGTFHREQLFQTAGLLKPGNVARLLHEQKGIFTFLCQACLDSKPQTISKKDPGNPEFCTKKHKFDDHKCLVHVLNSTTVKYSKIRPLAPRFQMDLCRHQMRYGCLQEDTCNFAHSHVELCVWLLQKQSDVTPEDIVQESERMWKIPEPKAKQPSPKPLDLKMKIVCGQCLQNGRWIEADRDGKYCAAKARHSWTKEQTLIVMSKTKKNWVPVRPLPSVRMFPQQYEICVHVQNGRKCQYPGNCTFAHSNEEKDMWTYMKENKILDLTQVFDLCKKNGTAEKSGKAAPAVAAAATGSDKDSEKQILMPTDYADLMAGFHCYLCGKNSNSEKQWQKHIQSEKHKDRVFTLESEDSLWKYRFPAGEFKLCERYEETRSCTHGNDCPFAHGREELAEWHERRQVLQLKVSKAREDKLLEPSDSDFGKYTFLMQDLEEGGAGTL